MKKAGRLFAFACVFTLTVHLMGCMPGNTGINDIQERSAIEDNSEKKPEIPEKLIDEGNATPKLKVYDTSIDEISEMDIETYIMGVVAGEMKNDWPEEALKAQAILARTFVLKFCQDKNSKYEGADISTDVEEAQAYSYENINERVRNAVEETRGEVMLYRGELPYAWFHAHAGGMTELPAVSLDFKGENPEYLKPVQSPESEKAPEGVKNWTVEFDKQDVVNACKALGVDIDILESVEIGEKGASGRAKTLLINGKSLSAPSFRIKIGANKLKSTLIDSVEIQGDKVAFSGSGFGHGVGMSQWGAYAMAESGKDAEEIVEYYFPGTEIEELW